MVKGERGSGMRMVKGERKWNEGGEGRECGERASRPFL